MDALVIAEPAPVLEFITPSYIPHIRIDFFFFFKEDSKNTHRRWILMTLTTDIFYQSSQILTELLVSLPPLHSVISKIHLLLPVSSLRLLPVSTKLHWQVAALQLGASRPCSYAGSGHRTSDSAFNLFLNLEHFGHYHSVSTHILEHVEFNFWIVWGERARKLDFCPGPLGESQTPIRSTRCGRALYTTATPRLLQGSQLQLDLALKKNEGGVILT